MHIKQLEIDGFKSYCTRTVITGFDKEFNAITGLNGSGKSNILDAICFVLGITNLSQVRASNLQELVYKQGQAGITKATVSMVLDNTDAANSPIGYEHHDEITVTRQVQIGGTNKYYINGKTAQAGAVANMFQSVQLNVNNPHFLIMQGRITKVLNMKPMEILGMLEEAAGTRMYESKKQAAMKTIEKKDSKVEEINSVLATEITPKLDKLKSERALYVKFMANNTECERSARFVVAFEFTQGEAAKAAAAAGQIECSARIKAAESRVSECKATAAGKEVEIRALERQKANSMNSEYNCLVSAEDFCSKELVKVTTVYKHKMSALKDEEKAHASLVKQVADAEAVVTKLEGKVHEDATKVAAAEQECKQATAAESALRTKYNAVSAGIDVDDDNGDHGTAADQLIAAKSKAVGLQSDIASCEMRIKHLKAAIKDLDKAVKEGGAEHTKLTAMLSKSTASVAAKQAKLAALNFDAVVEGHMQSRKEALSREVAALQDQADSEGAALSTLIDFDYDASSMGPGWDPARVKGTVATLLRLRETAAATALEVAAGGKLFQVVVDNEHTGKALLANGKLKKRVTLIPLTQIKRSMLRPEQIAKAAELSKGKAVPLLSTVEYPASVAPAMEYAFGSYLLCPNADIARAITFNELIRAPTVTLDGDMFDPAGTLEGGSKPASGGQPIMIRIGTLLDNRRRLAEMSAELEDIGRKLDSSMKASATYNSLSQEIEMALHEVKLLEQRVASSQRSQTEAKHRDTANSLASEEMSLTDYRAALKEVQISIRSLEATAATFTAARESRMKALEKEVENAKKASLAADRRLKEAARKADASTCEAEAARKELSALTGQLATAATALKKASAEVTSMEVAVSASQDKHAAAKSALDAARESLQVTDKAMKKLVKDRDAAITEAENAEADMRNLDAKAKSLAREAAEAGKRVADMLMKHAWIASEKHYFGKPNTDYDFSSTDPKEMLARLQMLEKQQAEMEKKINKKVIGMIETAEREYADLMSKKRIIENDKLKINRVIAELDEKKNEALRTTWEKVNKDFGSIFSTLLPGVVSKLEPQEGMTVLDGLEVKVAFNGVWKDSLTELSGGQRSLLALSLILALLLFKPAPMYILDEVDAALDLSHTQNIGHMIRTHFSNSQFIVVSLKQGMFSNANVIFRTKFVEGVGSTVTRTVPTGSALLADEMEAAPSVTSTDAGHTASSRRKMRTGKRGKGSHPAIEQEEEDDDVSADSDHPDSEPSDGENKSSKPARTAPPTKSGRMPAPKRRVAAR